MEDYELPHLEEDVFFIGAMNNVNPFTINNYYYITINIILYVVSKNLLEVNITR